MTERPTEQTSPRLSALDTSGAPSSTSRLPFSDRLQQRFGPSVDDRPRATEATAVRPAVPAAPPTGSPAASAVTSAPEAPEAPAPVGPVLPPPAAEQEPARPTVTKAPKAPKVRKPRTPRASKPVRPPRRARLRMTRIDPWSVMKTSFLLSIALGIVTIVSVLMVWSVLGAAGVWDSINTAVRDIVGDQAATPFTIQDYLGTDRVIGFTMLVAVIDVVLLTAIATLSAFLYNMSAALLGGIDITLVEDEH